MHKNKEIMKEIIGLFISAIILVGLIFYLVSYRELSFPGGFELREEIRSQQLPLNSRFIDANKSKNRFSTYDRAFEMDSNINKSTWGITDILILIIIWFVGVVFTTFAKSIADKIHKKLVQ